MPNHRMSSGISASVGIARLIWTGPSINASPDPAEAGQQRPGRRRPPCRRPARGRAVQRTSGCSPGACRPRSARLAVSTTVHGAESVRGSSMPVAEPTAPQPDQQRRGRPASRTGSRGPGRVAAVGAPDVRPSARRGAARTGRSTTAVTLSPPPLMASAATCSYRMVVDVLDVESGGPAPRPAGPWSPGAARSRRPTSRDVELTGCSTRYWPSSSDRPSVSS